MKGTFERGFSCLLLVAMATSALAGCGNSPKSVSPSASAGSQKPAEPTVDPNTPATLTFYSWVGDEKSFNQFIGDFVKKKFPNITIKVVYKQGSEEDSWNKTIASGEMPDILTGANGTASIALWNQMGLSTDLTDLVKKYKFDLSRFDPAALQAVKNFGQSGQLNALPWFNGGADLYYNKDIFDKFGVSYPKDGMTWDQVVDMAKKLTKTDGGVQYRGFDPGNWNFYQQEYALAAYDPKTKKSTYTSDPHWATILNFLKDVYSIPGNMPAQVKIDRAPFTNDKNVAMIPWASWFPPFTSAPGLNFNVVSLPTFKDAPGKGVAASPLPLGISQQSKNKDLAFQVIAYLESDEVQTQEARIGQVPALDMKRNKAVADQFGADIPNSKGVNMQATFYNDFTVPPTVNGNYETSAEKPFYNKAIQSVVSGTDVNTALRTAQDEADKAVQDIASK